MDSCRLRHRWSYWPLLHREQRQGASRSRGAVESVVVQLETAFNSYIVNNATFREGGKMFYPALRIATQPAAPLFFTELKPQTARCAACTGTTWRRSFDIITRGEVHDPWNGPKLHMDCLGHF